jgi:translation initiation factor 2 alpha subunit (eIF-2alpha)
MAERKREWPEADDLVIAAVKVVMYYGAYAKMGGQCVFRREK